MYKPVQSKSNHQYIVDELKKMVLTGVVNMTVLYQMLLVENMNIALQIQLTSFNSVKFGRHNVFILSFVLLNTSNFL